METFFARLRRLKDVGKIAGWIFVFIISLIGVGWFVFFKRRCGDNLEETSLSSENVIKKVTAKISAAKTDVLVETAIIKTKSDSKRKNLKQIKKIADGMERRKKLNDLFKRSI